MNHIKLLIFFWCFVNVPFYETSCFAQIHTNTTSYPTLLEKVAQSGLVVEGKVIGVTGFRYNKGQIFSSAMIKTSKIFKGASLDTMIEVIFDGGEADSILVMVSHGVVIKKGMQGIFLLTINNTDVKLMPGIKSYLLLFGQGSLITYHDEMYMVAHHVATSQGATYDDLEKDLFQPIEAITKTPRKVLGPNMFEREAIKVMPRSR